MPKIDLKIRKTKASAGAIYVEFALVAGLFLGFLWCIMEVTRYMAVLAVMRHAANEAAQYASTIPNGDIPKRLDNSLSNPAYANYRTTVLNKIQERAISTINASFIGRSTNSYSMQKLVTLKADSPTALNTDVEVAVVRPGDAWTGTSHPIPAPDCPVGSTDGATETVFKSALRTCPYMVEIRAEVKPLFSSIPIVGSAISIPSMTLIGRGLAFREPPKDGNPNAAAPVQPPPPPPLGAPSPTPYPTVPFSNTFTPGPAPSDTPTRRPTFTFTSTFTPTTIPTQTETPIFSFTPTETPTFTNTRTPSNTSTPTQTWDPLTPTITSTPIPTSTPTTCPDPGCADTEPLAMPPECAGMTCGKCNEKLERPSGTCILVAGEGLCRCERTGD